MVPEFSNRWIAALLIATLPILAGCSGTLATFGDDRSQGQTVADNEIVLNINKRLLAEQYRDLFFNVTTDVFEGRVMLTGTVGNAADRQRASQLIAGLPGVRTVFNDLQITKNSDIGAAANDVWIDTKLRAQTVANKNIKSLNYRWRVVHGTVYLLGRAQNAAEKNEMLRIVRQTSRVKGLVDHIAVG